MSRLKATDTKEGQALIRRCTAGVRAVRRGADPELTLSYVVWPGRLTHWYEQRKAA